MKKKKRKRLRVRQVQMAISILEPKVRIVESTLLSLLISRLATSDTLFPCYPLDDLSPSGRSLLCHSALGVRLVNGVSIG